jgi:beta-galactosidase/beta-glucuronidase
MKSNIAIQDWRFSWIENAVVVKNKISIKTPEDISAGNYPIIKATVPGNFELDFMREGLLDDVYMGANSVKTQKLENLHLYYFTEFDYASKTGHDSVLCFEGVDTAAEIYLDGELLGFVENMLHAHRFDINGLQEQRRCNEKSSGTL